MQEKKVSVVIPTYNRGSTIVKSVYSVLRQTYSNVEIIIVDDNSEDDTFDKISEIEDPRVIYIHNVMNVGPAAARNIGIRQATGEYIAFQDSDDEWKENKIIRQLEKFRENSKYMAIYCAFNYHKNDLCYQVPKVNFSLEELETDIYNTLLHGNTIGTPTLIVKREVLSEIGLFNEKLKALEDWDLALRIARKYKIGYVNECLVDVFYSANSVNLDTANLGLARTHIYTKYFKNLNDKSPYINEILYMIEAFFDIDDSKIFSQCKNKLIESGFIDKFTFDILQLEIEYRKKSKWNYEVLNLMYQNRNEIEGKILNIEKKYFSKNKINVAVYGIGNIGRILVDILNDTLYKPSCIIDKQKKIGRAHV